jgi:hypothetical protein
MKEIQFKTTLRSHLTQSEWQSSRKQTNASGDEVGERNPLTLLVGMEISAAIMEISMETPQKTKNTPAL